MAELCDRDVFEKGASLCALDARSAPAETWVQRVALLSAQRVDWHYSGGVAHVLVLGDHARALHAAKSIAGELDGRVIRWYEEGAAGLYRAGVTEVPEGAIGAVTTSGETEWIGAAPSSGDSSVKP